MNKLSEQNIQHILFIDIETVPLTEHFYQLNESIQTALQKSYQKEIDRNPSKELDFEALYHQYGGIKAEYSQIICIGLAFLYLEEKTNEYKLKTKTLGSDGELQTEKELLTEFATLIHKHYTDKKLVFCGHNIAEFDIPFISRRFLVNRLPIPPQMNYQGKKPWDIEILDTMNMWKFGDYKNFTSLELLCAVFSIPTPKQTLSGDKVKKTYYQDKQYELIKKYCINDVIAVAQLLLSLNQQPLLTPEQIIYS